MVIGAITGEEETAGGSPSPLRGLRWRIKDSFVSYVMGHAGGRYALTGGAELLANRYFAFPPVPGSDPRLPRFAGGVAFSGHGGMLRLPITDPALRDAGDHIDLTIVVDGDAVAIAILDRDVIEDGWVGAVPLMTDAGRELFGGVYGAGEQLDPLLGWSASLPPGHSLGLSAEAR
jgi:hypothetical protein